MRFTVDIDDKMLKDLKRFSGTRKKSPAVSMAVADFVRRQKVEELIRRVNSPDNTFSMTLDDLKKQRRLDARRQFSMD